MRESRHTPGPWEYVPSNENHGPYVSNGWGAGDICDCYVMSNPQGTSVRNGGTSRPIHHQRDEADANARLIAAAPDMLEALHSLLRQIANPDPAMWIHPKFQAARDRAIAAIAKAEGRS